MMRDPLSSMKAAWFSSAADRLGCSCPPIASRSAGFKLNVTGCPAAGGGSSVASISTSGGIDGPPGLLDGTYGDTVSGDSVSVRLGPLETSIVTMPRASDPATPEITVTPGPADWYVPARVGSG